MMNYLKKCMTTVVMTALTGAAGAVIAADFPSRPIQIIVPYGAGGTIDLMARRLGPKLQAILGQSVIVDNRPGAGTMIGAGAVARAEPDGHTLFLGSNAAFTISPQVMSKVPYDPMRSFAAIGTVASFPNLILVAPQSPYKTLADIVQAARKSPGKLSYASFGPGSTAQLSGEAIKVVADVDITHVPYKSGAQSVQAILSGEVTFGFDTAIGSVQRVKAGQMRALAATSAKRMADLPEVPSIIEAGYPSAEVIAWVALFAPAATPEATQKALSQALRSVLGDPEIKSQFASMGVEVTPLEGKATMDMVRSEYVRFGKLIEKAKIRVE
jgi:tripartite-type tricarboxylate transporter receptor subunit TctC